MGLPEGKIPFSHAVLWIFFSTLLVSGSAFMGWQYYLHLRDVRLNDDQYQIVAIVQKTSQKESLKTMYLAELLGLSIDKPVNLYQFDIEEGEQKLKAFPLIKTAAIKKIRPGTLFIDYEIRIPVAYLENYSNTVVDEEGYLFPFSPFFTPKNLPAFFLPLDEEVHWGDCLGKHEGLNLAFKVLEKWENLKLYQVHMKRLDVSRAFKESLGQRQIVLVLEEHRADAKGLQTYLRLNPDHFYQNLVNYRTLRSHGKNNLGNGNHIVDLRIPHTAYIRQVSFL